MAKHKKVTADTIQSCSLILTALVSKEFYEAVLSQILAGYPWSGGLLHIHTIIRLSNQIIYSCPDVLLVFNSILFVRKKRVYKKEDGKITSESQLVQPR